MIRFGFKFSNSFNGAKSFFISSSTFYGFHNFGKFSKILSKNEKMRKSRFLWISAEICPCEIPSSSFTLKSSNEIANISADRVSLPVTVITDKIFQLTNVPVSVPHNKTFLFWINSQEVISARISGLYSNLSWRPTSPFFEFCNVANLNKDIDQESL